MTAETSVPLRAGAPELPADADRVELALAMLGICKRFPGVVANDHVDFEASRGEVHALLGENGAGKTTLSHILTGLYRADEGEIRLFGVPVRFASPRQAIDAGICMVHQQFRLVERFTVAENILLGDTRGDRPPLARAARARSRVRCASSASATACPSTRTLTSGSSRSASSSASRS